MTYALVAGWWGRASGALFDRITSVLGLLTCLLLTGLCPSVGRGHEISFQLVPEKAWNDGRPAGESFLPEGQIFLFRHGRDRPELVLEANVFGTVPPGDWYWIAEAPGHVSVVGGLLQLPRDGESARKTIIWPVVPACDLDLSAGHWAGVSRLDAVSLDRHATYPVIPSQRKRFAIPAGRFLVYTLDARGLAAIGRPASCLPDAIVALRRPEPPAIDKQDLMISARLPQEPAIGGEALVATLQPSLGGEAQAPLSPTAAVWVGGRVTYFFLDVPAGAPWQLAIQHPELLSHRLELASSPGSVRELEDQQLRARLAIEMVIEYRPERSHARAAIVVNRCGERPRKHAIELEPGECIPVGYARTLQPGTAAYDFGGLDTGWYRLDAWIDDERVIGLGSWLTAWLTPDSPARVTLPPQRLQELEIYGHLLVDGEPVAGEVRIEPFQPGAAPARRFATDEDLVYRLTYFGVEPLPFAVAQLPEALRTRPLEELRGLGFGSVLRACSEDGSCRLFHHRSTFMGEGRFDIDLGSERELRVDVSDARRGKPVEGATVVIGNKHQKRADTLHFLDGEVFVTPEATGEAIGATTDARGQARVRQLEPGSLRIVVLAKGFRRFEGEAEMPAIGEQTMHVELEPEAERGLLRLRFPDGSPAVGAALVGLTAEGAPDYLCTKGADTFGEVELAPECLEVKDRRFVVMHPRALIELVTAGALEGATELEIEEQRELPMRARLLDPQGEPLAGVALAIRLGDLILTPNHFLAAAGAGGALGNFRTDAHGEIVLRGLDPGRGMAAVAPVEGGSWTELPHVEPGGLVEVLVESPAAGR